MSDVAVGLCSIWRTPVDELRSGSRDGLTVDSPRAGGRYFISGSTLPLVTDLTPTQRVLLTTWLVNQRSAGFETPEITTKNLQIAISYRPLTVAEKKRRALTWLRTEMPLLGQFVEFLAVNDSLISPHTYNHQQRVFARFCAELGAEMAQEAIALLGYLDSSGLIISQESRSGSGWSSKVRFTYEGLLEAEEYNSPQSQSHQAFVAMWFSSELNHAYTSGIEPGISEAGYRALRIDAKDHNNKIDDEIIAEIRRSRFVVADFTCGLNELKELDTNGQHKIVSVPRGGVYFEAGLAKGLGLDVIWTCRNDMIGHVHFDTRQFNHILWETPDDLKMKLSRRISATIGDGPLRSNR